MNKGFDSIMQGLKEFAEVTNNTKLLNKTEEIQHKTKNRKKCSHFLKPKILPQLSKEYNNYYVVDASTVKSAVLRHSGYKILHRPYFGMKNSTHEKWQLNPHTKIGIDAAQTDAKEIPFKEFFKLFEKADKE